MTAWNSAVRQTPQSGVVGRDAELELLRVALERGATGAGSAVLVSGEPGIGKTALVQSALDRWTAVDEPRLTITCLPLHALNAGLAPLRAAIHRSGASPALVRTCLEHFDAAPLRAVDDWLDDVTVKHRVVVVVDDVQWADVTLRDVLLYVLAGAPQRRVTFVVTARTVGLPDGHPLHGWLADLQRLPAVTRLDLGPLSRPATELQLAALLGAVPHHSLVDEVFATSRGNPYLSALLVRDLQPNDRHLPAAYPRDLVEAVHGLWHDCSAEARTVTRLIAVAGAPQSTGHLATAIAELELAVDLDAALRQAETTGVLERGADGRFWFHHPLQAEVLEQAMPETQRREFHAAFARLDSRRRERGDLRQPELCFRQVHRYLRAGATSAAYDSAMRAWDLRRSDGPTTELRQVLRQAIDLRPQVQAEEEETELWRRVRLLAAEAGAFAEELEAVDALIDRSDPAREPLAVSELLVRRMLLRIATATGFHSVADMERAVELAATDPTSWQYALALAELAHTLGWQDDPRAPDLAKQALSLAEATGHPSARSLALTSAAIAALDAGDPDRALALATRAADVALAHGDWWAAVHAVMWESNACPDRFGPGEVARLGRRREQLLAAGAPSSYVTQVAAVEAQRMLELGDATSSTRLLREAIVNDPGPIADLRIRLILARAAAYQGRPTEALAQVDRARELIAGPLRLPNLNLDVTWATALLEAGRPGEAYQVAVTAAGAPGNPVDMVERLLPLAARALADQLQDLPDAQRLDSVLLGLLDDLRAQYPTVLRDFGMSNGLGPAHLVATQCWYDAELARGLRDVDEADRWRTMAESCEAASLPWLEAYACWRAAEAQLAQGHGGRGDGARWLRTALRLAEQLGAQRIRTELVDLARLARVDLGTHTVTMPLQHPLLAELTPREREIVPLLAMGRTYAEIAAELVISEKTVSSHVSNILRKTGTASRVELTRQLSRS